eukprot:7853026-Pyramimonas_sp.AAC.1
MESAIIEPLDCSSIKALRLRFANYREVLPGNYRGLSRLLRWAVGRRSRPTGGGDQISRVIWLDRGD